MAWLLSWMCSKQNDNYTSTKTIINPKIWNGVCQCSHSPVNEHSYEEMNSSKNDHVDLFIVIGHAYR